MCVPVSEPNKARQHSPAAKSTAGATLEEQGQPGGIFVYCCSCDKSYLLMASWKQSDKSEAEAALYEKNKGSAGLVAFHSAAETKLLSLPTDTAGLWLLWLSSHQ